MRNGEKVWYCKRISKDGDKVERFAKPRGFVLKLHYLTMQPASGYSSVVEFGENIGKTLNCIAQPYYFWTPLIHEGDRFYADGARPKSLNIEPEDGWGCDANYRVYSARPQNEALHFILQKID